MKDFMCINQEAESKVRPKLTAQQIHLPAHIYTLSTWLEMTRFCDLYTCKWKTETSPLPNYKWWDKIRVASRGCPQPDCWWPFPAASLIFLKKKKKPVFHHIPFLLGYLQLANTKGINWWVLPRSMSMFLRYQNLKKLLGGYVFIESKGMLCSIAFMWVSKAFWDFED